MRIHTDETAQSAAAAVHARAFTAGSHIYFNKGLYDPSSAGGRELLAHELTHVAQQTGGAGASAAPVAVQRSVGSPAGGCGICFGTPADAGSAAHRAIQRAFVGEHGRRIFPEFPVPPSPTDENGRLDLMVPIRDGFAIGEIKPANVVGLLQGDLDLFWYEDQLRRLGFRVERLNLAPPPPFPFVDPQAPDCPQELTVARLDGPQGLYVYSCEPDFRVLRPRCRCRRKRREDEPERQRQVAAEPKPEQKPAERRVRPRVVGAIRASRSSPSA